MRAVVKTAPGIGNIELRDVPEPRITAGQVKIRVMAASVCGSDMSYWLSDSLTRRLHCPVILGHEGAGLVEEAGPGVRHVKPGDRVVAATTLETCLECDACLDGRYNDCKRRKGLGSSADGFFAEFVVAAAASVHAIPDWLSFDEAALLEPAACVTHALFEQGMVRPYHEVLVAGPGPIGLFAAQVAKLCGATVMISGTGRSAPRLELAKRFGVDYAIDSSAEDVTERVRELTGGRGVDMVVDCSGSPSALKAGIAVLKDNGLLLWMGTLHDDRALDLEWNNLFLHRQTHIVGARSTTPASWGMALRLMRQRKLNLKDMISCRLPLEAWEQGFAMVRDRAAIKVILDPTM